MKSPCPRAAVAITVILVFASSISAARAAGYYDLIKNGKAEMESADEKARAIATREEMQAVINSYEAANTFRQAEEMEPTIPLAWFWRGVIYNRIGQVINKFNKDKCKDQRGAPAAFCMR